MSTTLSEPNPIDIMEGVEPSTDNTNFSTKHWVSCDKIRFVKGRPRKIKGWSSVSFDRGKTISGKCRSIFSASVSDRIYTLLGTHTKLYSLIGTGLVNITPLKTTTVAVANSLATHYATLANDPVTTANGSGTVVIADTEAAKFTTGDIYTLSGAATTNGITDTLLNADHIVRSVGANTITIIVGGTASSSGTGGGASVVRSSGLVTVTAASHGQSNGDRTKILGAATFGGITDTLINIEHTIRNVAAGAFDIMTTGTATSSASAGGGASTTYQAEIAAGSADESFGQGYGMGKYGVGLYGISKLSATDKTFPRIWFFDRFGDVLIGTPGNGTGLYSWSPDTTVAPALIANAPTAINYAFVSDNILVTFGKSGVENRIATSDQNAITTWAGTPENQVYEDDIEGAGRFISHVNVRGVNLIFTEQQTYTFRKISREAGVWEVLPLDLKIGLIAPMARIVINGIAYWMGPDNFYMWRGGNIEVIPSNSSAMSTLINYVFDDINLSQKSKCFVEYVEKYNEIRFHYPSSGSNEPDRVACVNISTFAWWPDTIDRTAAEYPDALLANHRMISSAGILYSHETGNDDDTSAMTFTLASPKRYSGKPTAMIAGLIPDSVQTGNITATLNTYLYPQSATAIGTQTMTVTPTTEIIPAAAQGRHWKWSISGSALGQKFIMGDWQDELQKGSPQ